MSGFEAIKGSTQCVDAPDGVSVMLDSVGVLFVST